MIKIIDTDLKEDYLEELEAKEIIIRDFTKLKAYQLSLLLYKEILLIIETLPDYEKWILCDQIRRSSQGICSAIAESQQLYKKREISFLSIGIGSLLETENHLLLAKVSNYITDDKFNELEKIITQIKQLLVIYIRRLLDKKEI